MKASLILAAIAALLVVVLGMQWASVEPRPDEVFTFSDEMQVRDELPGGTMVRDGTAYRRCENSNGNRASQGLWVYYGRDGRRRTHSEGCWR